MSFSSAEARPASRGANLVPVLLALLLAWLSTSMNAGEEAAPESIVAAAAAAPPARIGVASDDAHELRGVFATSEGSLEARSYHPTFQTSGSTGVLGFWMLVSLCGLLLGAALAPRALQWLWRHVPMGRSNHGRHQG